VQCREKAEPLTGWNSGNKETEAELRQKLADEIGDTFVYLDLLAQSLGLSVAECAAKVFNEKSAEIGYPVKL
jgi:NTP pyrophosphatase (non-canonical NTP hydrolase)